METIFDSSNATSQAPHQDILRIKLQKLEVSDKDFVFLVVCSDCLNPEAILEVFPLTGDVVVLDADDCRGVELEEEVKKVCGRSVDEKATRFGQELVWNLKQKKDLASKGLIPSKKTRNLVMITRAEREEEAMDRFKTVQAISAGDWEKFDSFMDARSDEGTSRSRKRSESTINGTLDAWVVKKTKLDNAGVTSSVASSKTAKNLRSSFRGCMLGALIGDCFGSFFEGVADVDLGNLVSTIETAKLRSPDDSAARNHCRFTDDTLMMHNLAESLLVCKGFNGKDMARRWTESYFKEEGGKNRGYGGNVVKVFSRWKENLEEEKFDVFLPAREQFNGSGSYGNGSAMRISPVALFCHSNYDEMLCVAEATSHLTHTHLLGSHGGVIQCIAVGLALEMRAAKGEKPTSGFALQFFKSLKQKYQNYAGSDARTEFLQQFDSAISFLQPPVTPPAVPAIRSAFGNGVSAAKSVITAIWAFAFISLDDIEDYLSPELKKYNPFELTIIYAISLGGDTDTIASMAGAIAGAFYGEEVIKKDWYEACEAHQKALDLADRLTDYAVK